MTHISIGLIIRLTVLCSSILISACSIFHEETRDTGIVPRDEFGNPILSQTASYQPDFSADQ